MINNKGLKYGLANMANLSIRHEEDWGEYASSSLKAGDTCERFLHSASLLPAGKFLGWQIDTRTFSNAAFSSLGKEVAMEDIAWIFHPVADTSPLTSEWMEDLRTDGRKVYILSSAAGSARDVDGPETRRYRISDKDGGKRPIEDWICEMYEKMAEIGAVIRIIACGTMENRKGHGMILISIPDKITLRMRSMLSVAFPHLVVDEVDKMKEEAGGMKYLPDDCFLESMHRMLSALVRFKAEQKPTDEIGDGLDDIGKNSEGAPIGKVGEEAGSSISIAELDLSARAYNQLMRAGIKTVEKLQTLSYEELLDIRHLGRKSAEEVRQKLAEFQETGSFMKKTYMERLDELVGLTDVKEQIRKIAAFAKMKKDMSRNGNVNLSLALNMGFVGKPGTAKTTVARLVAGIFHEIGLLPCSELIEVGRADLVAGYVGQTAIQVQEVFMRARGKVLFIDEAYSLVDDRRGLFGDEAINAIIQEMENNRDKTIVIFAGYPDEMESFFLRNPGLKSRVPFIINFSDYSVDDMIKIAELEAKSRGFSIGAEAYKKVTAICSEAAHRSDAGNGRFCRNLIENAILGYASRIYGNDDGKDKDRILSAEDFTSPIGMDDTKKIPIGFHA